MPTAFLAPRSDPERVFERLYRRYVGDVYRYALVLLGNAGDAEDVTQTAFLNACRAFQRGERPERPLNWLITITHNVCRQRFRQAARRPSEVALEDDLPDRLADEEAPRAEELRQALSQLAFNQRAALVMRELEGRSCAEIADVLGLSRSAVEALLFRARRALREQLEGALTCSQAERSISRQLDGRLERNERGALRAHLRACPECATAARRMRAQRSALRGLIALPLPSTLATFSAGGGATVAGAGGAALAGLALKTAALSAAAAVVAGAGYEAIHHRPWQSRSQLQATSAVASHAWAVRAKVKAPTRPTDPVERLLPSRLNPPHTGLSHGQARPQPQPTQQQSPAKSDQLRPAHDTVATGARRQNVQRAATKTARDGAPGRTPIATLSPHPAGHTTQVRRRATTAPSPRATAPTPASVLAQASIAQCKQAQLSDPRRFALTYNTDNGGSQTAFRRCLLTHNQVANPARTTPATSRRK